MQKTKSDGLGVGQNRKGIKEMQNVECKINGDVLTITVDLSKTQGRSKSGKTEIIATTSGNKPLEHSSGAILGLNIYKPLSS